MPSQSSSPSPEKGVAPAAMTERLIQAAVDYEAATSNAARKELFAARAAVEAALTLRDELLAVAKQPVIAPVGTDIYLGFQDEHGFWSVDLPQDMIDFAKRWDEKRRAAIARATEGQ